jgi:DNA polymerase-3 subunit alpha
MSIKGPFVSLHNHTELGSPLDGMNDVEDLFVRAKEVDHPAVAVTDHGTMTAIYDAWKASKKTGVKLIPGMEAYFSPDLSDKKNYHLVLLAQNEVGYRNILRLNYEAYRNQVSGYMGKQTPRFTWEHIEQFNEGVIALTACSNGLIAKTLITEENEAEAICYLDRFHSIFKDRFFLEIQPHNLQAVGKGGKEVNQKKLNEAMIRLSHDKGIPYVITCDAHYRDKDHAKYHDFMLAIKDKKPVNDPDRFRYGVQDMYLKTYEEITNFFDPQIAKIGMENSIKIMESCQNPTYIEPKGAILPKFPVQSEGDYEKFKTWHAKTCPEVEEDKSYLRYKCMTGFKEKLAELPPETKKEYWERVK